MAYIPSDDEGIADEGDPDSEVYAAEFEERDGRYLTDGQADRLMDERLSFK